MGVVNEKEAVCAEILAISHPVAFLEGSMGVAPPVEDLHAQLLEQQQLRPSIQKVLQLLPRTPPPPRPQQQQQQEAGSDTTSSSSSISSAAPPAAAAAAAVGQQQLYGGGEVPQEMIQLLPTYWDQVGTLGVCVWGGGRLRV